MNVTGVELFGLEDLVSREVMEEAGFTMTTTRRSTENGDNVTSYFVKDDCNYVYAEAYIAKVGKYLRLIIEKSYFTKLGMIAKPILLKTGSGDGSRGVPCVSVMGVPFSIHKAEYRDVQVDHINNSLNIITSDSLRQCTTALNAKNKKNLHAWGKAIDDRFFVEIKETRDFLIDAEIKALREQGFTVKAKAKKVYIYKEFDTEIEAIKTLRAYEKKVYGEFAYNPLQDLRGHFQIKFEELILGTKTKDDITREILEDYRNDAKAIARYDLESEYERFGMTCNHGITLANGQFVSSPTLN